MIKLHLKTSTKYFVLIVFCSVFAFLNAEMEDACDLYYNGDPSELNDSTIDVPDEVVAVSAKVMVDMPVDTTITIGGTPSLFFIIDHSLSMISGGGGGGGGNDQWGERFTTSLEFIDSIRAMFPSAEVGIAVFREHLYFDPADSAYFVPLTDYPQGAYCPFFKLDSSYVDNGGNPGYIVIRNLLQTDTVNNAAEMVYVPTNNASNEGMTNINVGFAAAKHAFPNALYDNNRQFIIFLSDGEATIFNGPNTSNQDFITDVEGLPTTFTIFFTQSGRAPQSLIDMTDNIQSNGYSSNNLRSNYWAINVADLMDLLMDEVMEIITGTIVGLPVDITVNGTTVSDYDTVNNIFSFDDHFPLTGWQTDFVYKINYTIAKDSITPGGDTIVVVGDSTAEGNFSVAVDPTQSDPPDWYPNDFELICWQRELLFYYDDAEITEANETMDSIELRFNFDPGDKNYNYTDVKIEVTNKVGGALDKETITLSGSGNSFRGKFKRQIITAGSPAVDDGTLQHFMTDTIVATFRNNERIKLPLDTLVSEIPFVLTGTITIVAGYYFDNNADGFVDSIFVEATTDMGGGLTDAHVQEIISSAITLPDFRNFSVNGSGVVSGGFYIDVFEDNPNPTTYVTSDDVLEVSETILTNGGYVPAVTASIYDRVAPIIHWEDKAAYLIDFQVDTLEDSLTIKFSEPVTDVTHARPFLFLSMEENTEYQVDLNHVSHNSDIMKFTVADFSPVTYMRDGDSVWIQRTDRVGDIIDPINYQNNNNNTKRKLWVERRLTPFDLIPNSTSPINISNPDNNSIIPSEVVDIINNIDPNWINNNEIQTNNEGDFIGMVITVKPDTDPDILLPDFELEGDLSIFDAVGNQLVSREEMLWWDAKKTLIWIWDGKNMNGRNVGSGSYLAIAEIEEVTESLGYDENGGPKQVKRVYVGIAE